MVVLFVSLFVCLSLSYVFTILLQLIEVVGLLFDVVMVVVVAVVVVVTGLNVWFICQFYVVIHLLVSS
jgi:hypothetical protein